MDYAIATVTAWELVDALDNLHMPDRPKHMTDARTGAMVGIMSNIPVNQELNFADIVETVNPYLGYDSEPTDKNAERLGVVLGAFKAAVDNH